jgi:hypothetical protein
MDLPWRIKSTGEMVPDRPGLIKCLAPLTKKKVKNRWKKKRDSDDFELVKKYAKCIMVKICVARY